MTATRIVLVVPSFPELSETFIVHHFLGLLERGFDVHVACWKSDETARREVAALRGLEHRIHVAWPQRPRALAAFLWPAAFARSLARNPAGTLRYLRRGHRVLGRSVLRRLYLDAEIVGLRPDLVHVEFGALAVDRMHLGKLLDCRIVVSFRGYDLNYAGLERPGYYDPVWRHADALHLLGRDLWRRARRRGCPETMPHVLIPPAIDAAVFDPGARFHREVAGTEARPLRILSVGRLEWQKGYEYALAAVRLLRDRGIVCRYRIVGRGRFLEAVAFARHELGLEDCVELVGGLPPEAVRAEMADADVLLHAAVTEGFCNAVLEAQAMRLPPVVSDAGGLGENVAHGETGYVVPRRDPEALASRLEALVRDPELLQRMGEAGRRRVLEHFQIQDQIDRFAELYRSLDR